MDAMTKEELAELEQLEREEQDRLDAEKVSAKRQHLEAMRLSKRLAQKHGTPGRDFVVLETTVGNIAIRRPVDVELDTTGESEEDERSKNEKLARAITLHPASEELDKLLATQPALAYAIGAQSMRLCKVLRAEEEKK